MKNGYIKATRDKQRKDTIIRNLILLLLVATSVLAFLTIFYDEIKSKNNNTRFCLLLNCAKC